MGTLYWTSEALHYLPHSPRRDHLREVLLPINYFLIIFSVLVHGTSISIFQGTRSALGKGHPTPKDDDPIPIRPGADIYISRAQSRGDRGADLSLTRTSTRRAPAKEYLSRHISIPSASGRGDQYRSQLDLALDRVSTRRQTAKGYLSTINLSLSPDAAERAFDLAGDDEDPKSFIPAARRRSRGEEGMPGSAADCRSSQAEWIRKGRKVRGEPLDGDRERSGSTGDASNKV